MSDLKIEDYSEKSFVVFGVDTKLHINFLKELGGKYNRNLRVGPGWIFSKRIKSEVKKALKDLKKSGKSSDKKSGKSSGKKSGKSSGKKFDKSLDSSLGSSSSELIPEKVKHKVKQQSISDGDCVKNHGKIPKKKTVEIIAKIEEFCGLLNNNKVKDSKEVFVKLPSVVQCLFLNYAWQILSKKSQYSDDSYLSAFRMFKLFRSKELRGNPIYSIYLKLPRVETDYKKALKWNKTNSSQNNNNKGGSSRKAPKKYDKNYQRKPEPESEIDPLYIFYTTLYTQKKHSPLAVTWLTEHGVFTGTKRMSLEKKYKKLLDKKELIK